MKKEDKKRIEREYLAYKEDSNNFFKQIKFCKKIINSMFFFFVVSFFTILNFLIYNIK